MSGLPPIVMQSAGEDPIHVDANKIETACAATVSASLDHRRFGGFWHDFQLQVNLLPEARDAIDDLGRKLRSHLPVPAEHSSNDQPTKG
jgi:acetyl esterase/lipase